MESATQPLPTLLATSPPAVGVGVNFDTPDLTRPVAQDGNQMSDEEKEEEKELQSFWDFVTAKIDEWKNWFSAQFSKQDGNDDDTK